MLKYSRSQLRAGVFFRAGQRIFMYFMGGGIRRGPESSEGMIQWTVWM